MQISFDPEMTVTREVPDIDAAMLPYIGYLLRLSAIYLKSEEGYYLLWEPKNGRS